MAAAVREKGTLAMWYFQHEEEEGLRDQWKTRQTAKAGKRCMMRHAEVPSSIFADAAFSAYNVLLHNYMDQKSSWHTLLRWCTAKEDVSSGQISQHQLLGVI